MQQIDMQRLRIVLNPAGLRELADELERNPEWTVEYLRQDRDVLTLEFTKRKETP